MATILVTGATGTIGSRAAATAVTRAGAPAVDVDLERPAREASEEETRAQLLGTGLPPPVVGGVVELHAHARSGRAALVTRTVEGVTGSPARAFPVFARANAALWSAR